MKWNASNRSLKRFYDATVTFPYRFTRAYGKRSNWVNAKRRNAR